MYYQWVVFRIKTSFILTNYVNQSVSKYLEMY